MQTRLKNHLLGYVLSQPHNAERAAIRIAGHERPVMDITDSAVASDKAVTCFGVFASKLSPQCGFDRRTVLVVDIAHERTHVGIDRAGWLLPDPLILRIDIRNALILGFVHIEQRIDVVGQLAEARLAFTQLGFGTRAVERIPSARRDLSGKQHFIGLPHSGRPMINIQHGTQATVTDQRNADGGTRFDCGKDSIHRARVERHVIIDSRYAATKVCDVTGTKCR